MSNLCAMSGGEREEGGQFPPWEVWVFPLHIELTNLILTVSDVGTLLFLCVLHDNKRSTKCGL